MPLYTVDNVKSLITAVAPNATVRKLQGSGAVQVCHPNDKTPEGFDRTARFKELRDASLALEKAGLHWTFQAVFSKNNDKIEFPALFIQDEAEQRGGRVDEGKLVERTADAVIKALLGLGVITPDKLAAAAAAQQAAPPAQTPPASGTADY